MYQDALSEMDFLQLDLHEWQGTYTVLHMSRQVLFGAGNQGIIIKFPKLLAIL